MDLNEEMKRFADETPQDSAPVQAQPVEPTDSGVTVTQVESHDDTDVPAALQRETQDGKGDGELPEGDFESFATDGMEHMKGSN